MKAFSNSGNIAGALHLYKLQSQAEDRRRIFRYQRAMSMPLKNDDNKDNNLFSSYLPPPSRRTAHVLLEILRDNKMYEKSIEILNDICKRATYAKLFSGSSPEQLKKSIDDLDVKPMSVALTPSGEFVLSMQYEPDQTTYALVIEACIESSKADLAMDVYNLMETWGLKPDRLAMKHIY
jgi:pentatricopeptide repeat protein